MLRDATGPQSQMPQSEAQRTIHYTIVPHNDTISVLLVEAFTCRLPIFISDLSKLVIGQWLVDQLVASFNLTTT